MENGTRIKTGNTREGKSFVLSKHESVAAGGGTLESSVPVGIKSGDLQLVGITSLSTNLRVELFDDESLDSHFNVYDAVFSLTDTDGSFNSSFGLEIDGDYRLFARITNDDATNATGDLYIRLGVTEV